MIVELILSLNESADRPAWTQTLEQGMGSGMTAYNHKQPRQPSKPLEIDYYIKSEGKIS